MATAFLAKPSPLYSSGFFGVSREKNITRFSKSIGTRFSRVYNKRKNRERKKNSLESGKKTQANNFNSRASALGERDKSTDYI